MWLAFQVKSPSLPSALLTASMLQAETDKMSAARDGRQYYMRHRWTHEATIKRTSVSHVTLWLETTKTAALPRKTRAFQHYVERDQ